MSGNAHKRRSHKGGRHVECLYCRLGRPKHNRAQGLKFKNKNGHRHNPAASKKQKHNR